MQIFENNREKQKKMNKAKTESLIEYEYMAIIQRSLQNYKNMAFYEHCYQKDKVTHIYGHITLEDFHIS